MQSELLWMWLAARLLEVSALVLRRHGASLPVMSGNQKSSS
jgi:hypothetical protein